MGKDLASEVFGIVLVFVALGLAVREHLVFRARGADAWLLTSRRYNRRLLVSATMAVIGLLLALWGHGSISFKNDATGHPNVALFTGFVLALTVLSLVLLLLAALDIVDTTRNAAKRSLDEFPLPEEIRKKLEEAAAGADKDRQKIPPAQ